jgi:REP element-mobilizing transposase RayT
VHVTLRVRPEVAGLRRRHRFLVVRRCIAAAHRDGFRVVEFNILHNHLHLIIEAGDARALTRGLQSLETRIALRMNRCLGRPRGKVFADRYHARVARTPREVRALLVYVLHNARHHAPGERHPAFDVFSSAASFDGWAAPLPRRERWQREALSEPRATAPPTIWLLTAGWRRHGAIRLDEAPRSAPRPPGPM